MAVAFGVAVVAGAVNAIAGGGTLLSFPSLLALDLPSRSANVTNTMGLWPASIGGAWSYRREVARSGKGLWLFLIPSFLGGATGSVLLLRTDNTSFKNLVPWLILGATVLFMLQAPISRWLRARLKKPHPTPETQPRRWLLVVPFQFLVAVYGGYFGAGIGILMLATLGFLGLDDLIEMNGIKNLAAACINGVAIVFFSFSGLVHWPIAAVMAVGALIGGYASAGFARKVNPKWVRLGVVIWGLGSAAWTMWQTFR